MENRIYALGFFDGVHLGHQALLAACCRLAREQKCIPCAITFDRHPQSLRTQAPPLIGTLADRLRLLRGCGMEQVEVFPVTQAVMDTPWEDFLGLLVRRGAAGFVCGRDFRFGRAAQGTAPLLEEFCRARGLPCRIVDPVCLDGQRVSSSRIRALLEQGQPEQARRCLGRPHSLTGTVIHGAQLGRTLGTPTANVPISPEVIVPALGVYACVCQVDGARYAAVTNVGRCPTVGRRAVHTESWLPDFSGDLYGHEVTLEFYEFLRPERKFDSLSQLRQQILRDEAAVRAALREEHLEVENHA